MRMNRDTFLTFIILLQFFYGCIYIGNFAIAANKIFFCLSILIYVIVNVKYLKLYEKQFFCFELFFSVSYFACCFLYPLMENIITRSFIRIEIFDTREIYKLKFLNLSFLAYYCYMLGLVLFRNTHKQKRQLLIWKNSRDFCRIADYLCSFFLILFLLNNGISILARYQGGLASFSQYGVFLFYIDIFLIITSLAHFMRISQTQENVNNFHSLFKHLPPIYVINTVLIIFFYLASGFRSRLIQVLLPLLFLYCTYIKSFSGKKIVFMLLLGFFAMSVIGLIRGGESYSISKFATVDYLQDFIPANAAGMWLVEYSDTYGPTYGTNAILQLVSVIPFAQTILVSVFDEQTFASSSSLAFTGAFITHGETGLGTNIIGDLYYTFGGFGTVFFMYVLGMFIRRISGVQSAYAKILYLTMISIAIFAPRVEYFYIFRQLGFSVILFMFLSLIAKSSFTQYKMKSKLMSH